MAKALYRQLVFFVGLSCIFDAVAQNKTLTFDRRGQLPIEIYIERSLERAYAGLGYSLVYSDLPLARSYKEAHYGNIDGLKGRTDGVIENYANLLRVPVALIRFDVVLIVDEKQCGECGMAKLTRVATVRGFRALNNYLKDNTLPFSLMELTSRENVLTLLSSGRVEAAILTHSLIPKVQFAAHPNWAVIPLTSAPLYHYLHQKHAILVEQLSQSLLELERSGELKKLRVELDIPYGAMSL